MQRSGLHCRFQSLTFRPLPAIRVRQLLAQDLGDADAAREDDLDALGDGQAGEDDVLSPDQQDVSQVEVVGGDVHGHQRFGLAAAALQGHLAREEAEAVGPFSPLRDQHELLEGHLVVGREGVQQLLHRGVDVAEDGNAVEQAVQPPQRPPPDHIGGEDSHEEDQEDRHQEAHPGDVAPQLSATAGARSPSTKVNNSQKVQTVTAMGTMTRRPVTNLICSCRRIPLISHSGVRDQGLGVAYLSRLTLHVSQLAALGSPEKSAIWHSGNPAIGFS